MKFLGQLDFWLLLVGSVLLLRQLFVAMAAEHGRKQDLVKKLYKATQDFHLSVLIPYLDNRQLPHLMSLLRAIEEQAYPMTKVSVHIATCQETQSDLDQQAVPLSPNVRVWHFPAYKATFEDTLSWLIDRCLAVGGSGIFVFLKPTDMIKPDFFQNIVARGFDSFAIQGYVANKGQPESPLARMLSLSRRLTNRIDNAGRYHMGLSCRLLDSGWAIKQEVLEMIPFHRGRDLDNLEYTLRLNLQNYRVSWAPNVVVYSDEDTGFLDFVSLCIGTAFNRLRMSLAYGPRLLTRALLRLDLTSLEDILTIVKPPALLMGLVLALMGVIANFSHAQALGQSQTWYFLAGGLFVTQLFAMLVARCKPMDYAVMLFVTPAVYAMSAVLLPLALMQYVSAELVRHNANQHHNSYKQQRTTRFDEDMDPAAPSLLEPDEGPSRRVIDEILHRNDTDMASLSDELGLPEAPAELFESSSNTVKASLPIHKRGFVNPNLDTTRKTAPSSPAPKALLPREHIKSVPLSNGRNQVDCLLKTHTTYNDAGDECYRLTLEYKSLSFSTATYRILDQAFYELYTKLSGKGLTIINCGSCGYFYNPTADVPGALRNAGICLFGKMGKDVNLNTDAVTVLSQACDYHTSIEQREEIVQQWKDSLARAKVRSR